MHAHSKTSRRKHAPSGDWSSHEEDSPQASQQKWASDGYRHHSHKEEPNHKPEQNLAARTRGHSSLDVEDSTKGFQAEWSTGRTENFHRQDESLQMPLSASSEALQMPRSARSIPPRMSRDANGALEHWSSNQELESGNRSCRSHHSASSHRSHHSYKDSPPRAVSDSELPKAPAPAKWEQVLDEEGNVSHFNSASGALQLSANTVRCLSHLIALPFCGLFLVWRVR